VIPEVVDLGRQPYARTYAEQIRRLESVIGSRDASHRRGEPGCQCLILVEHEPVITVSRRPGAADHLTATPAMLARAGVEVAETDRGGDITYHGPGQLVIYPILDLSALNLGIHAYMRLLEDSVIAACATFGVPTMRDERATGVWTIRDRAPYAKIAAMGVRVRRWVSMHGLALNVRTNLEHFNLIVPCGLHGRPVTSLDRELAGACPTMDDVKRVLVAELSARITDAARRAGAARSSASASAGNRTEPDGIAG